MLQDSLCGSSKVLLLLSHLTDCSLPCFACAPLQVLQDSLCGSSKVLLVCCISPEASSAQESLSSLNFASRAAQVSVCCLRHSLNVAGRCVCSARPGEPVLPQLRLTCSTGMVCWGGCAGWLIDYSIGRPNC